jgi:hypothetical protein
MRGAMMFRIGIVTIIMSIRGDNAKRMAGEETLGDGY